MMLPGEIDADGWRMPKKPRAIRVYYLAKLGLKPRVIAKIVGLKATSVRVMTYWMRNPKLTPHGYAYDRNSKTSQRRHDFTGKHAQRHQQFRERELAIRNRAAVSEREERAYNGSRYR